MTWDPPLSILPWKARKKPAFFKGWILLTVANGRVQVPGSWFSCLPITNWQTGPPQVGDSRIFQAWLPWLAGRVKINNNYIDYTGSTYKFRQTYDKIQGKLQNLNLHLRLGIMSCMRDFASKYCTMMDERRMEDQFKLNKHPKGHCLSPKDPHVNCIFHLCIWNIFLKITIHIYIISYYNMHPILHIYYPHPLDTWCRISHHSPMGLRLAKHLQESTQAKWWGSRRRACPGPKFRIHGTNGRYIYLHANHKNSTKCRWMYQSHGFYDVLWDR